MAKCKYDNERCLCQSCVHRTDGKVCGGRDCKECELMGREMHDIWMCSSYRKEDENGQDHV